MAETPPSYYTRLPPFAALFATGVPMLMYHKLGPRPRGVRLKGLYVGCGLFARQLAELRAAGFVTPPLAAPPGEAGNPGRRLALTFDYAADLVTTFGLESLPVDTDPRGTGYRCTVEHFPLGVIFCIVPYNWPYNLTAHKIAPALATGNTVVVKPSPLAPLSTLTLLRIIHEAGCPPGVVNGWNGHPSLAQRAVADPRIKMLSFTGSAAVGWKLKELMPDRRVALELGGDASVIICEDANLDWAIQRTVAGAFGYAGQICISIQHLLIQSTVYEQDKQRLIDATTLCPSGDPMLPTTVCGPLISSSAADKVMSMIEEATAKGATILAGGTREGNIIHPTLIENVSDGTQLACEEAFGPVLTIAPFETLDDAIKQVNASQYGIQAGVFTESASNAEKAYRTLEVGGVIINDYPTLRFDNMPYGGVKRSGFGREGVQYTMAEMTTPKTLLVRT